MNLDRGGGREHSFPVNITEVSPPKYACHVVSLLAESKHKNRKERLLSIDAIKHQTEAGNTFGYIVLHAL